MKKHLYNIALLSSTLLLVGCGGSSGSGSSTGDSNLGAQFQSQLDDIQRQLGDVTTKTAQNSTELTKAEVALADANTELDSLQASPTAGSAAIDAAQEAYNRAADEVARLKAEAAELGRQKAILKEQADTVAVKVEFTQALSSFGTELLGGTLTKSDVLSTIKGVNGLSNDELRAGSQIFAAQMNSVLSSAQSVKSTLPRMLNSPAVTELAIPIAVQMLQKEAANYLANTSLQEVSKYGVILTKLSDTEVTASMDVKAFVKKTTSYDESYLTSPSVIMRPEMKALYTSINSFIDGEFTKYARINHQLNCKGRKNQ